MLRTFSTASFRYRATLKRSCSIRGIGTFRSVAFFDLPSMHAYCLDPHAPLLPGQGFPQWMASVSPTIGGTSRTRDDRCLPSHSHNPDLSRSSPNPCPRASLRPDFDGPVTHCSSLQDQLRCRPNDTKHTRCCLNTLSRIEHIDGVGLRQEDEATVFLRPGN